VIVFLDTNVVLDVLARRQPFYEHSAQVWALAELGTVRGLVSAVSLTNVFYIVRKRTGRKAAMGMLRIMRNITNVVACDSSVVNQAIDADFEDFEDAVQYFSAAAAEADALVTRNTDHYPESDLPVMTPKEFLAAYSFA
jgi:predicted nucleic acid-binding protein